MKKIIFFYIILLFFIPNVSAKNIIPNGNPPSDKISAELVKCDSISNVWLKFNEEIKRVRLIAYDSADGNLNNEINNYYCNILKNANKIEVEYDIEPTDKYNRELLFIYADGEMLQEKLIAKGYGQVNFVKGNYKNLDEMCSIQKEAISNSLGIWNYPDISEKYCNSGVEIGGKEKLEEKTNVKSPSKEKNELINLIFINSGILVLLLLFRRNE